MQKSSSSNPPTGYPSSNPSSARKASVRTARQNPASRCALCHLLVMRRRQCPAKRRDRRPRRRPRRARRGPTGAPTRCSTVGPTAPTCGSANGASNSSSQPPATTVSLFKKTMHVTRRRRRPLVAAGGKPRLARCAPRRPTGNWRATARWHRSSRCRPRPPDPLAAALAAGIRGTPRCVPTHSRRE